MLKLIISSLFIFSVNATSAETDSHSELSHYLNEVRVKSNIPAMAVAVITAGEVSYSKGFGYLNEKLTTPVTDKTLFRAASISKLFTAQAIMKLVELKKLSLNDDVGLYIPQLEKSQITIKQLLTHSSGLSDVIRPASLEQARTLTRYFELVNGAVPEKLRRNSFEYSDTNFNLLGEVIYSVSGQRYETFIYDNILKPARVERSNFYDGKNEHLAEAPPTHKGKLIDKLQQRPYDLAFNPSEGLVANVVDLSRWLTLTLNNDPAILEKQSYEAMLVPQVKTTWSEIYMGLGWQVYENEYGKVARHPGSVRGYKSLVLTYSNNKNAIIILSNSSGTPRWEIAKSITDILKTSGEW
ncbi:serine hydrolase domain-containing protein [Alteromonas sp. 1_MG-2023]|uniref:serine hydrolase domain-containing protein n=1 Tax=Alteromonas sp. 1_MG-2023 TaxID=3062669 RepID=UPI0026E166CE|nr:serine hydrolase domain-containing protein [Alteromonas sp. 1_MG-2023]MDO6565955.1 serine hydrolase domain-containing protein [Alteromonas sp. 1_MG-2023]